MTITAIIIADSISAYGPRITTLQLRYPRFIHAEFMTHRAFSRNASSSRAIPVQKLIQDIIDDTAMPLHWGKNQPGMQAREEHDGLVDHTVFEPEVRPDVPDYLATVGTYSGGPVEAWDAARNWAIHAAEQFAAAGYHKQIVNRLLEPFSHINVVVTATDWENFFELRDHPDAQPEIQVLARAIKDAMAASVPDELPAGLWHLPYATFDEDLQTYADEHDMSLVDVALKVSVARCARVSYLTHDGRKTTVEEDVALHDKLVVAEPLHASPAEHQATPVQGRDRNFNGWRQYRSVLEQTA
ncbi:FAD-dependent thymidylate synthase [Rhizobium sp. Leaf383]|uniref:FAD-dependent thymidylate synthase n=1 Tax=Rhizobium sp. Leaf383 TaxID=1736357 RepID=UPI000713BAFC|nr:FAD-dependent thymidylate synthase [Rhizobium sp. Leaf383]KQS84327.1 hypothetical protein ASG58_21390 [Rhizobium sp. Leaf383]